MALFKNLYMDFSFLNPIKKKQNAGGEIEKPVFNQPIISPSLPNQILTNQPLAPQPPTPKNFRELPQVSRRLIEETKAQSNDAIEKKIELPKIVPKPLTIVPPIGPPKIKEPPIIKNEPVKEEPILNNEKEKILEGSNDSSFFSSLYSHIIKEDSYIHGSGSKEALYKNLFEEMRGFWQDKKEDLMNNAMTKAMKTDLAKKIDELQLLEVEWQKLQLQNERTQDELASKEILIENNIRQLRKTFKKLHLNSALVRPEHYFKLPDGDKLKSLQELYDKLQNIDNEVFNYHVNSQKNDFANWVNDILGLNDLAQNLRNSKTKEQMSDLIHKWYDSV